MKRIWMAMLVVAAGAMTACGGKVVVDGASGNGGAGGTGSMPVACPSPQPNDSEVMSLPGQPCDAAGQVCASNNGCGGCSVSCNNGVWASTDGELCFSVGGAC